jgi:hypothetical protein
MKASINRKELLRHKKALLPAKPDNKELLESHSVLITVSDCFCVIGPGFRQRIPCHPLQWGTVSIPYSIWSYVMKNFKHLSNANEITVSAANGELMFDNLSLNNPDIKIVRHDKNVLELPINADPLRINQFIFKYDADQLKNMGLWNTATDAVDKIRRQIANAAHILSDCGIEAEDLENLFVQKCDARTYFLIKMTKR